MNRFLLPRLALLVVTAALTMLGQQGGGARLAAGALPAISAVGTPGAASRRAEGERVQAERGLAAMLRAARAEVLAQAAGGGRDDDDIGRLSLVPWLAGVAQAPGGQPLPTTECAAGHGAASGLATCRSPTGPPVA